jgi:hypothetical protein
MFHHLHRRNWFIPIVISLSIVLLIFVGWAYWMRGAAEKTAKTVDARPTVTTEDYQREVGSLLKNFWSDYRAAADDSAKQLILIEKIESELLSFRVPADERSLHLQLATLFEAIRSDLIQNENKKLSEDLGQLNEIFLSNQWLGAAAE